MKSARGNKPGNKGAKRQERQAIGVRLIEAMRPGEVLWDATVKGFSARRRSGPTISYSIMGRKGGKLTRFTIGVHGQWNPTTARAEAIKVLAEWRKGRDPQAEKVSERSAITIKPLGEQFIADCWSGAELQRKGYAKGQRIGDVTIRNYETSLRTHIYPLLADRRINTVTTLDLEKFRVQIENGATARGSYIKGGVAAAVTALNVLSTMFNYARRQKLFFGFNPCSDVVRPTIAPRERHFSDEEFGVLGNVLRKAATDGSLSPVTIAAIRCAILTGMRKGEIERLPWAEVDLDNRMLRLKRSKTGPSNRPLSAAACDLLASQPRRAEPVFIQENGKPLKLSYQWRKMRVIANLLDSSPHVCRHSIASIAAFLGYDDRMIEKIIGHRGKSTIIRRYIHREDPAVHIAADHVGRHILYLMGEGPADSVVPLRQVPTAA